MTPPLADDQAALIIPTDEDPSEDVVRVWVVSVLAGVPRLARLRAVLVANELVSNARQHGLLPCVLRLSLDHTRRYLLVLVEDCAEDDGALWPVGAGLALVDGLSSDWAVDPRLRGKSVWAEIPLGAHLTGLTVPPQPLPDTEP